MLPNSLNNDTGAYQACCILKKLVIRIAILKYIYRPRLILLQSIAFVLSTCGICPARAGALCPPIPAGERSKARSKWLILSSYVIHSCSATRAYSIQEKLRIRYSGHAPVSSSNWQAVIIPAQTGRTWPSAYRARRRRGGAACPPRRTGNCPRTTRHGRRPRTPECAWRAGPGRSDHG